MFTLATKWHFRCGPPHSYCSHFITTKSKAKRDQGFDPDYTLSKKTNSVQIQTSHLQNPLTLTGSKIVRFCIARLCEWIRRKDILFNLLYLLILRCSDFLLYWFLFAVPAIKPRTSCMLGKYAPELHPQPIWFFNLIIQVSLGDVCIYSCRCMHEYMHMWTCMWRPEVNIECLSQLLSILFFKSVSPWTWSSSIHLNWLATEHQRPTWLHILTLGLQNDIFIQTLHGCWRSKLGSSFTDGATHLGPI